MLFVDQVLLRVGDRTLFDRISFRLHAGQRVAVTGRNGQGKSTLFRAIMGEIGVDSGKIELDGGRRAGYLPQNVQPPTDDRTAIEEVLEALAEVKALESEIERLIEAMTERPDDEGVLTAYGKAQDRFESLGGYDAEPRARTIMHGLGFTQARMDTKLRELSGGWLMRVQLARLLLECPDLLILDEPTNHLDIEAREWLLEFLGSFEGAVLLTSHDRHFLDSLVTRILQLELGKLGVYHGNYSYFETESVVRRESLKASYERQQKELKAHQEFIAKNRAHPATARMAQSRIKVVEKMELIVLPPSPPPDLKLRFPETDNAGQVVFRLEDVAKSYGELTVFDDVNLELQVGKRLAVVGINGAGKSTLLKLLAGHEAPTQGKLTLGHNVRLQYFSQYAEEDEHTGGMTLLQYLQEASPPTPPVPLRSLLGGFMFSGDDAFKEVRVLSGGERARLKIARMLLQPGNVLVMDEPTNHLDLHSQGVLLQALKAFSGTVIFVSHDRQFVGELATDVLSVADGRVTHHPCDYEQFRWRQEQAN